MARIERPDTAFRDAPRQRKTPRVKADAAYLSWIHELPCLITGQYGVDGAHIRYKDQRFAKRGVGVAEKPSDHWVVPLSRSMHTRQHNQNEKEFWQAYSIDPTVVAAALYLIWALYDGDKEMALIVLRQKGRLE